MYAWWIHCLLKHGIFSFDIYIPFSAYRLVLVIKHILCSECWILEISIYMKKNEHKKIGSKWKIECEKYEQLENVCKDCVWIVRVTFTWFSPSLLTPFRDVSRFQYKYFNVREHRMCDSCQLCIGNGKTISNHIPYFLFWAWRGSLRNETIPLKSSWRVESVYSTTKEILFKYIPFM